MGTLKARVDGTWEPITEPKIGGLLPSGGATGQRLTKTSSADYATAWAGVPINEYTVEAAKGWHVLGAAGEPALQNGWVNYEAAWGSPSFRMNAEGWVFFHGLIKSGTAAPIFTLPPAYRPWKTIFAPALSDPGGVAYLMVNMDGTVHYWLGWGTNGWLNLSTVRFPVWNKWSQFVGRYIPLEGTVLRGPANWSEYATGLWPQPNGMTRIMGISGAFPNAGSITHLNNAGGHVVTPLFGVASEDAAGSRCFSIGNRFGFNFNGPQPATNWTMFSSEFGTMACEDRWIAPSLLNGWVNHGPDVSGRYPPAGYWKDSDGVVHLRGLLRNGSSAGAIMTVLPVGYRPTGHVMWFAGSGLGTQQCRIDVHSDGTVYSPSGGSTGWTSWDGINFYAAGA